MTTYTPADVDRLATEFDQMLRWHMTGQEYAAAVLANSKEADPDVCHTHDFIDANMSMLAAWEVVTGQAEIDGDNDADTALWNAAWKLWRVRGRVQELGLTASQMVQLGDGSWSCTFHTPDGRFVDRQDYADGTSEYHTVNATYHTLAEALREMA